MDKDLKLMRSIRDRWGKCISDACHLSSVPPTFLAALTANESGGNPNAYRFEPAVYAHLCAVAEGRQATYWRIRAEQILDETVETVHESLTAKTNDFHAAHLDGLLVVPEVEVLRDLATSWGLTQIMGYHMIGRPGTVTALLNPDHHYYVALELLSEFAERYGLDVTKEFEELFRCWNTGIPTGRTFDPAYIPNGLRRMELYEAPKILGGGS